MIEAKVHEASQGLDQRLANKAKTAAEAHAENAVREARRDPWRWRKPSLLWPKYTTR